MKKELKLMFPKKCVPNAKRLKHLSTVIYTSLFDSFDKILFKKKSIFLILKHITHIVFQGKTRSLKLDQSSELNHENKYFFK